MRVSPNLAIEEVATMPDQPAGPPVLGPGGTLWSTAIDTGGDNGLGYVFKVKDY